MVNSYSAIGLRSGEMANYDHIVTLHNDTEEINRYVYQVFGDVSCFARW